MDEQSVCASGYTDYKARFKKKKKGGRGALPEHIFHHIPICHHFLPSLTLKYSLARLGDILSALWRALTGAKEGGFGG